MRFQPDLLFERDFRHRAKTLRRLVMLLAEILLDRMAHDLRFGDCLGLVLDPKPRLALRRIANVPHASSNMASGTRRHREGGDAMSGDRKIRSSERVNSFLGVVFMRAKQAPPRPRTTGLTPCRRPWPAGGPAPEAIGWG